MFKAAFAFILFVFASPTPAADCLNLLERSWEKYVQDSQLPYLPPAEAIKRLDAFAARLHLFTRDFSESLFPVPDTPNPLFEFPLRIGVTADISLIEDARLHIARLSQKLRSGPVESITAREIVGEDLILKLVVQALTRNYRVNKFNTWEEFKFRTFAGVLLGIPLSVGSCCALAQEESQFGRAQAFGVALAMLFCHAPLRCVRNLFMIPPDSRAGLPGEEEPFSGLLPIPSAKNRREFMWRAKTASGAVTLFLYLRKDGPAALLISEAFP